MASRYSTGTERETTSEKERPPEAFASGAFRYLPLAESGQIYPNRRCRQRFCTQPCPRIRGKNQVLKYPGVTT